MTTDKGRHSGCDACVARVRPLGRTLVRLRARNARSSRPQPRHTPAGNRTTALGRFPGSRVVACVRLPEGSPQWHIERVLAGYSCGGSRGLTPRSLLNPLAGNLARPKTGRSIPNRPSAATQVLSRQTSNPVLIVPRSSSRPMKTSWVRLGRSPQGPSALVSTTMCTPWMTMRSCEPAKFRKPFIR
jgi:hypothetical protein